MNMNFSSAVAVAAIAGAISLAPNLANAGVSIGITLPGAVYAPGYSPYSGRYYYEPIYIGGAWYHGPYRWRMEHGQRVFWVNGRWRHNEWRESRYPEHIAFRNGGYYRGGHYEGWSGAERFNARFHAGDRNMHGERRGEPYGHGDGPRGDTPHN